jgi:hypothetical protein
MRTLAPLALVCHAQTNPTALVGLITPCFTREFFSDAIEAHNNNKTSSTSLKETIMRKAPSIEKLIQAFNISTEDAKFIRVALQNKKIHLISDKNELWVFWY